MIKIEDVEVCAKITRSAFVKESSTGGTFLSFAIQVPIEGRNGQKSMLEINVTTDGDKSTKGTYTEGRRVVIYGSMLINKKDERTYFNLRADGGVEIVKASEKDRISGRVHFMGKIDKRGVDVRQDKKGNDFKTFSGFTYEKDGEKAHFTYMRFLYFNPQEGEDFLQAGNYIEAFGSLQLGVFKDEVSLDCRVDEVKPWVFDTKKQSEES